MFNDKPGLKEETRRMAAGIRANRAQVKGA